jgi:TolB protein
VSAQASTFVPPSPAIAGAIVFARGGDIYVIDEDGERAITNGVDVDSEPAWSPDGTRIVFTRNVSAEGEDLWTRDLRSGFEARLTQSKESEGGAGWSPDGTRIAFGTFSDVDGGKIWLMRTDGSKRRVIFEDPGAFVAFSDWAPDSRSLLIAIDNAGGGQLHIHVVGVDGGGLTALTTRSGDQTGADWSPNGERFAYWSDASGSEPAGIFVMNADGTEAHLILQDPLGADTANIAWSPDGRQLAWTAKFEGGGGSPVFVMNADGTGLVPLTDTLRDRSSVDWVARE